MERCSGRKVGSAADYLIPLGILGIAGYIAYQYFLGDGANANPGTGLSAAPSTAGNNAGIQQASSAGTASTLATQAAAGQKQTYPSATLQGFASQIYTLGNQSSPDLSAIEGLLTQPNNLTDLTMMIQYFGTKAPDNFLSAWSTCGALGLSCPQDDLPSFVRRIFGTDPRLQSINQYYSETGINYQF